MSAPISLYFVHDTQALVVNTEVAEFRKRVLARQQIAALSAGGKAEAPGSTRCGVAAAFTELSTSIPEKGAISSSSSGRAAWIRERENESRLEARALATLRQRDRVSRCCNLNATRSKKKSQ